METAKFYLQERDGLQISKRISSRNGILQNDFKDKFIPQVQYFLLEDKSQLELDIDLLDSFSKTEITVEPDVVIIEGERACSRTPKTDGSTNFKLLTRNKQCGSFMVEIDAPDGFYFREQEVNLEESCNFSGVCNIPLNLKKAKSNRIKTDL